MNACGAFFVYYGVTIPNALINSIIPHIMYDLRTESIRLLLA